MYRGVLLLLLIFPTYACASVRISEIMYDAPGTDAGREWFELFNTEATPFDPTTITFFEADTHHKITHVRGEATVSSGGYAVVVDDPDQFLADFPNYGGSLFDSSWASFSNEGEAFELRDVDGNVLDVARYTNTYGATGDGMTLQGASNSWQAKDPTPGMGTAGTVTTPPPVSSPTTPLLTTKPSNPAIGSGYAPSVSPVHAPKVSAGGNRTIYAQVASEFTAELTGVSSEAKPFASYRWNFGNGEEVLTRALLYRYVRPGTYAVSVSVSTGGVTVADKIVVTVIPTELSILSVSEDGIELFNGGSRDIDLTDWQLWVESNVFVFPKNTTLLAGKSLFLEKRVSHLSTDVNSEVTLLYPAGGVAAAKKKEASQEPLQVVTEGESEQAIKRVESVSEQKVPQTQASLPKVTRDTSLSVTAPVNADETLVATSGDIRMAAMGEVGDNVSSGSIWFSIIALIALVGVASSAILLMKTGKVPSRMEEVSAVSQQVSHDDGSVLSSKSTLRIVARPVVGAKGGSKTNDADSYTIVE